MYHTFDGDGYMHGITFFGTEALPTYTKRYVHTRRLLTSIKRGFDVAEIGEQGFGQFDFFPYVTDSLLPNPSHPNHRMGKANTNMVAHNNRLFALEENDKPYEVIASVDGDVNLRTMGRFDFQ